MKTARVSIRQSGNKFFIRLDGKLIAMEKLAIKCNTDMPNMRRIVGLKRREKIVKGLVLKSEEGLPVNCKTFWRGGVPVWVQLVERETGVCKKTALSRIRQWKKDGDNEKLFRKEIWIVERKKFLGKPKQDQVNP